MKKQQKGFSLIELLIVVAIILIIAAIAIPNLLRSRMAANEASAVGSLRTINTAEVTYKTTYQSVGFGSLAQLSYGGAACTTATSSAACLIDDTLANATAAPGKSGYTFTLANGTDTYTVNADPVKMDSSGTRGFFTDETGVIRYAAGAVASNTSTPLQ